MKIALLGTIFTLMILCLFVTQRAEAAAPVSHVITALQLIQQGKLDVAPEDIPSFLRGTSFNDIRYLGVIDRTQTHVKDVNWEMVQSEKDPFKKGMLLHSLLDVAREKYMVEHNVYRFVPAPAAAYRTQIIKFTEDLLVHDLASDWKGVQDSFEIIDPSERSFGLTDTSITQWHQILHGYFNEKPTSHRIVSLIEKLRGANPAYKKLVPLIDALSKNPELKDIILSFYQNVGHYLETYKK